MARRRVYSSGSPRSTRSPVASTTSGRGVSRFRCATARSRCSGVRKWRSFTLPGVLMWVSVIWAMSMARSYIDRGPPLDYKRAHAVPGHAQDRQDPAGVPDRRRDGGTPSGTGGARPKTDLTDSITFSDPRGPRPPPGDRGPLAFGDSRAEEAPPYT